jgi:hypothetical protein
MEASSSEARRRERRAHFACVHAFVDVDRPLFLMGGISGQSCTKELGRRERETVSTQRLLLASGIPVFFTGRQPTTKTKSCNSCTGIDAHRKQMPTLESKKSKSASRNLSSGETRQQCARCEMRDVRERREIELECRIGTVITSHESQRTKQRAEENTSRSRREEKTENIREQTFAVQ